MTYYIWYAQLHVQHVFCRSAVLLLCLIEVNKEAADRTGGSWCFLCVLVWVCASVNVFLALFIRVCLSEVKRVCKKVFFTAYRPPFSPSVSRFLAARHMNHSFHLCVYFIPPCGFSHCLFMSVSLCCCVCVRELHWWNCVSSSSSSASSS